MARATGAGFSNSVRGGVGGGDTSGSPDESNIDFITISTGNATDFGDLTAARFSVTGALSNKSSLIREVRHQN